MKAKEIYIFTLLCAFQFSAISQPGGVNGPIAWYTSRKISENTYQWIERCDAEAIKNTWQTNGRNINFNDAALFETNEEFNLSNINLSEATVFGVFYPNINTVKNSFAITQNRITVGLQNPANKMIHSWHYINAAPLDNYSVWGSTSDPELKVNFQGYIPELAIYKRKLTRLEAWKVKSYFDIKYALTPDTIIISSYGKKYNEIKILWNPDLPVFKNFNNRLIAIGRDDQSGLKQPKSTTTYEEYDKKYEENEYSAYHNDADGARDLTGLHFVPDKDGTSIQRSLTVGFENDKLPSDDNTFLFIGDNAGEIAPAKIDQVNYKGLEAIGRKWLVYNKDNIKLPTKISVSGKLHDEIYDPYDYLKKRYVLLKFKGATDQIESLTLFSYFGRQVSKDKMKYQFYNNKIIWNDIYWDNAADDTMHYFTFGIVPILKLLSLNNTTIRFPLIDRDKPITCKINYKAYDFTYQNPNDIKIDIEFTPGIPPYQILVEKIVPAGKTTIVNLSSKIEDKNDKSFDNTTSDIDETKDDDPKDNGTIKFPKDDRYCQYTTPNLEANQTYVITITDKVGQEIKFTANTKLPAAPRKKRTP